MMSILRRSIAIVLLLTLPLWLGCAKPKIRGEIVRTPQPTVEPTQTPPPTPQPTIETVSRPRPSPPSRR